MAPASTKTGGTPIRTSFCAIAVTRHRFCRTPRYHFVASTVAPPLLGMIAGDHLVRPKSAAGLGKSRRIPFETEHGLTLSGLNHFDLLNHPLVYAKLRDWLAQSPRPASAIRAATSAATASVCASPAARVATGDRVVRRAGDRSVVGG